MTQIPRILIVAGSDSGGGAGIQADIKTITVLGGYAMTAITALTVQNTTGVKNVLPVSGDLVAAQMTACLEDIGADAVKIGMLANTEIIEAVAGVLAGLKKRPPVVLDPVMLAKGGEHLLDPAAVEALKIKLFPLADVITPNIPEAEALAGREAKSVEATNAVARVLLTLGAKAVLLTGGHGEGSTVTDLLVTQAGAETFTMNRIKTTSDHGTGCTLSSALTFGLASGLALEKAVAMAQQYVLKALRSAPGFGAGHGPLGHNLID